jgi:hypothetical protein
MGKVPIMVQTVITYKRHRQIYPKFFPFYPHKLLEAKKLTTTKSEPPSQNEIS